MPIHPPKEWEIKQATHAMDMLFSIECLPYVIYDLTEEVKVAVQYKQEIKRRINQAEKAIRYAAVRAGGEAPQSAECIELHRLHPLRCGGDDYQEDFEQ